MKRLICKIFGHKVIINKLTKHVFCGRCGKAGFMEKKKNKHGEYINYWIE